MTGLLGFSSGYRAMRTATCCSCSAPTSRTGRSSPDGARICRWTSAASTSAGGRRSTSRSSARVTDTLDALLPAASTAETTAAPGPDAGALPADPQAARRARRNGRRPRRRSTRSTSPPLLDQLAADDAVFIRRRRHANVWAARYLSMNGHAPADRLVHPRSMANALPQAIGAQAAYPGRQVVALSGDGGLAMLLGELLTLRQQQLPVKVVVLQQRRAGVRRAGDEGRRHRQLRHRPRQPRLRRDRPRRRPARRARRTARRARRRPPGGVRPPRPGRGRRRDRPPGAGAAAEDLVRGRRGASPCGRPGASSAATATQSSRWRRPTSASSRSSDVPAHMSRTMSVSGRAQQISTWPSGGGSSGSGE